MITNEMLEAVASGRMTWEQVLEQEQDTKKDKARQRAKRNRLLKAQLYRAGMYGWYPTGRMSTALWMRQREVERCAELRMAAEEETEDLLDSWSERAMSAEEAVRYGLTPVTGKRDTTAYHRKLRRRDRLDKTAVKKHAHVHAKSKPVVLTAVPELPNQPAEFVRLDDRPVTHILPLTAIRKSILRHARRHGV